MYDRLLFPTDGSEGAERAFEHVLDVAAAHGATVHVLAVADTARDSVTQVRGEVVDALETEGEETVAAAADRASERGVETVTEVLQGDPASTIVDYADDRDVDLVVMPTRGRTGLSRLLLGSVTERVVRQAEVPVLTLRPEELDGLTYPYEDVLVPTDGSECARAALEVGIDAATADGAALHVLSVVDVTSLGMDVRAQAQVDALEEHANDTVADAVDVATEAGLASVSGDVAFGSSVYRTILEAVTERDADLVVVGTHGRTSVDRLLLGSVAEKLVRLSPVPVMTVRGPLPSGD
ncbi:MAG: universal stress protein [Halorientalis sp.]